MANAGLKNLRRDVLKMAGGHGALKDNASHERRHPQGRRATPRPQLRRALSSSVLFRKGFIRLFGKTRNFSRSSFLGDDTFGCGTIKCSGRRPYALLGHIAVFFGHRRNCFSNGSLHRRSGGSILFPAFLRLTFSL